VESTSEKEAVRRRDQMKGGGKLLSRRETRIWKNGVGGSGERGEVGYEGIKKGIPSKFVKL